MFSDLHGESLARYKSSQVDPDDFDSFWDLTLAEARSIRIDVKREVVVSPISAITVEDVSFAGFQGDRIRAWLRLPKGAKGPLPTVVEFVGYGGGRGFPEDSLFWAACGFAHLQMDTRGQGGAWSIGATADAWVRGPQYPGFMTAGIQSNRDYYYRRLITDAVRAVDAALALPEVDHTRVAVLGISQGGGVALAVAGLHSAVNALVSYVPFLCDFPRAITVTDSDPYKEISRFLSVHREAGTSVLKTLSYFDGVNFAKRAAAPAFFTTALMDVVCPPSTVFGAFNNYAGPKSMTVYEHNAHEHKTDEDVTTARRLAKLWRRDTPSPRPDGELAI